MYGSHGGEDIIKWRLQTLARYGHDTSTDAGIRPVVWFKSRRPGL